MTALIVIGSVLASASVGIALWLWWPRLAHWWQGRRERPVPCSLRREHYLSKDGTKLLVECENCGVGSEMQPPSSLRSPRATEQAGETPRG